jgi:hypothetical protein
MSLPHISPAIVKSNDRRGGKAKACMPSDAITWCVHFRNKFVLNFKCVMLFLNEFKVRILERYTQMVLKHNLF